MRDLIRLYLQGQYRVQEAADGPSALSSIEAEAPDVVILDLMMPGMDGREVCRRIREESTVPIIILTARGEVQDRVDGLRLGADDYLVKPFDGRELQARVEAVLRRTKGLAREGPVHRGDLTVDQTTRTALWRGQPLILTPKEFDLLLLLVAHPGQVFTRDRLLDRVWGSDYARDLRTVDSHVKNLREKLGEGAGHIVTVWGVGYKFVEVIP